MKALRHMLVGLLLSQAGCEKVPLIDINAGFSLADAAWFSQEQTLFFFWRVMAEQGLGPESRIEVTYRTDDVFVPWTSVTDLPAVHAHLPVDCGTTQRCGSTSLKVEGEPREVHLRLRYHRKGELFLDATTSLNVIGPGPAYTNRSLVVYGVFDENNHHVQWRARHQFPTLRNQEVQDLGLRRHFRIEEPRHGDVGTVFDGNPYGYAFSATCADALQPLGFPPLETTDRAIFDDSELPLSASASPVVCARSTVTDAAGTFEAAALARKNAEVSPAFPVLRSPIKVNTQIKFVLRYCGRSPSEPHQSMQIQRLLLDDAKVICIDDWRSPGFADQLTAQFRARIDEVRTAGNDMVLTMALHHDEAPGQLEARVEEALDQIIPFEANQSSPRVSGVFVLDTIPHVIVRPSLTRRVLWCPTSLAGADLDLIPSESTRLCAVVPDLELKLGPFRFGNLPIFPTREQYLTFIGKYSDAQAGRMKDIRFLAPERTPISQDVPLGPFGTATFFNNELLTAAATDAFSFCASVDESSSAVVFRVPLAPEPLPLSVLPELHQLAPQPAYGLGMGWSYPFLTRLQWEIVIAGSATAFNLTVPFGITSPTEKSVGSTIWERGEFPLRDVLTRCTRFCDHPAFSSESEPEGLKGVYNVGASFRTTYRDQCYRPKYPRREDGGFPLDP